MPPSSTAPAPPPLSKSVLTRSKSQSGPNRLAAAKTTQKSLADPDADDNDSVLYDDDFVSDSGSTNNTTSPPQSPLQRKRTSSSATGTRRQSRKPLPPSFGGRSGSVDEKYEGNGDDDDGAASSYPSGEGSEYYIAQAEKTNSKVKELATATDWKRALKHKSGVQVFIKKDSRKGKNAPIFKGEGIIKGFVPQAVFAVVGTRKLWDDWYAEGNLIENLNDTTSLTYMSMKALVGTTARDLALVEKVEGASDGTIYFCSTSVETPKVPKISGRVRAHMPLNGWILQPTREGGVPSTKVTYFLQVNVKTFMPSALTMRYMARRPVVIAKIDDYLQSHGPPPMAGVDPESQANGGAVASDSASRRSRRNSTVSTRSGKRSIRGGAAAAAGAAAAGAGGAAFLAAATLDESADSYKEIQDAQKKFKSLAGAKGDWSTAQDAKGGKILMKKGDGDLPIVKASAVVEGATTEQVLATINSYAARKIWDDTIESSKLIEGHAGIDQGIYLESTKGVFPHLEPRFFVVAKGVTRDEPQSDHGPITAVAKSINKKKVDEPSDHVKGEVEVSGWSLEPRGDDQVTVTNVKKIDIAAEDGLKPFLFKLLVTSLATAPRQLSEFIRDNGYAPNFVRWEAGEAVLESDDGDLTRGFAEFKIGTAKGSSEKGEQKAWFQWSDKMYKKGISIVSEPKDAVSVARVEGLDRTVEVTFKKIGKGATFKVVRGTARSPDDVNFNGKPVQESVTPKGGAVGAGGLKRGKSSKANGDAKKQPNGDAGYDDGEERPKAKRESSSRSKGGIIAAAIPSSKAVKDSIPSSSAVKSAVAPKTIERNEKGEGKVPEDAMLIITPTLYFTRPQVMFVVVLLLGAFAYGKFT